VAHQAADTHPLARDVAIRLDRWHVMEAVIRRLRLGHCSQRIVEAWSKDSDRKLSRASRRG
jgi:hypothetical protein